MVMADQEEVKINRLSQLKKLAKIFNLVANLALIEE
jgi:glycyl-tRNA synthetase beta subunit